MKNITVANSYYNFSGNLKQYIMTLIKEIKDFFKITNLRFIGLRSEIKFLLKLSVFSILSIEFILNKIQPLYNFQYDFGVIYLKLCYSYFSAFVFYYLVVYSPRERRRIKSFRYLNNKLLTIDKIVKNILLSIFREIEPETTTLKPDIKKEDIRVICKQVNPQLPITLNLIEFTTFKNHYDFLNFQTKKIKLLISELIILNEILDENVFQGLTNINDIITNFLTFDINIFANQDMEYLSHSLYDLHFESNEMANHFIKNYRHRYNYEYHKFERIRNQKKK
nr:hypothetical protein [uncultured Flavobacterium sp.]